MRERQGKEKQNKEKEGEKTNEKQSNNGLGYVCQAPTWLFNWPFPGVIGIDTDQGVTSETNKGRRTEKSKANGAEARTERKRERWMDYYI